MNTIELELLYSIKIHPVVNVSRVQKYRDQVEDQKKEWLVPVVIEGEEKYNVEKILNKRKFRGKNRYLVWWKGYIAEEDTQKLRKNLESAQDLVNRFEEEYKKNIRQIKKRNIKEDCKGELPGRYIAKMLYKQDNKRFDREYQRKIGDSGKQEEQKEEKY